MQRTVLGQRKAQVWREWGQMAWLYRRPGFGVAWDTVGNVGWTHREKPGSHVVSSALVSKKRPTACGSNVMSRRKLHSLFIALGDAGITATSLSLREPFASPFLPRWVFTVTLHFQSLFVTSWWGRAEFLWLVRNNNCVALQKLSTLKVLAKTDFLSSHC